jgi:hypothetical protein
VTLTGETITAPSGRARVQLGSATSSDRRFFAVQLRNETGVCTDRFTINRDGQTTIHGDTTLHGDLIVGSLLLHLHDLKDSAGVEFRPLASSPEEAAPWQIYHAVESQEGAPIHQLRLELAHPADQGEASLYKLVIGHADSSGFMPCLSVTADCTVTVHGNLSNLVIQGQLVQRPVQADPDDPRFTDALLDQWLQGTTNAGVVLAPLGLELTAPAEVQAGTALHYRITVRNISTRAVAPVQIRGTLTVQRYRQTVLQQSIEEDFPALRPGQQEEIPGEYTVPRPSAYGVVIIAVTALGIGPAGNIVHTEAQRIVRVTVPVGSEPEGVL